MTAVAVVLALVLVIPVTVVLHELGHVLAARLVGYRVISVTIGTGQGIARFSAGSAIVMVHAVVTSGGTRALPTAPGRARFLAFVLGGPLATLATLVVVLVAPVGPFRLVLAALIAVVLVTNLVPYRHRRLQVAEGTDGWELLATLRGQRDRTIEWAAAIHGLVAALGVDADSGRLTATALELGHAITADPTLPTPTPVLVALGQLLAARQRNAEAREVLLLAAEREDLGARDRLQVREQLVGVYEESGELAAARQLLTELRPTVTSPATWARLGLVLAEVERQAGNLEAAAQLLDQAAAHTPSGAEGAWLEVLRGALDLDRGEPDAAERRLAQAVSAGADGPLAPVLAAWAALDRGDGDAARDRLAVVGPMLEPDHLIERGTWELGRARLERLEHDPEAALGSLDRADESFATAGASSHRARVTWERARAEADRGDVAAASEHYRHAMAWYESMGCRREPPLLAEELAALSVEPTAPTG